MRLLNCLTLATFLATAQPSKVINSDLEFMVLNPPNFKIKLELPFVKKLRHYEDFVLAASEKYGINPNQIYAIIHTESSGNPKAVSPAGAVGLMQLMPITQRHLGLTREEALNPEISIMEGVRYYTGLLAYYEGNEVLALAAYNMGQRKVNRLLRKHNLNKEATYEDLRDSLYDETRRYVAKILSIDEKSL